MSVAWLPLSSVLAEPLSTLVASLLLSADLLLLSSDLDTVSVLVSCLISAGLASSVLVEVLCVSVASDLAEVLSTLVVDLSVSTDLVLSVFAAESSLLVTDWSSDFLVSVSVDLLVSAFVSSDVLTLALLVF